jgi:hypothetical protein
MQLSTICQLYHGVSFIDGRNRPYKTGGLNKSAAIHMKCSMTGQEKGALLIDVSA